MDSLLIPEAVCELDTFTL
jgi:hypothetical protein